MSSYTVTRTLVNCNQVIIELNTATPSFEGLHDITMTDLPPRRKPHLIMAPEDRISTPHILVDPDKVVAIIESDHPAQTQPNAPENDASKAIVANLTDFLEHEVNHGRLPKSLLPIQSGIDNIANAVVLQDSFLDLFDSGNLDFATATTIRFSPDGFKRFYDGWERYFDKLLLRSQQVSNSPEIICRLGVIGMNTPVEVDIYAHANSTCVMGLRMLNRLWGSADFLRSARYSIMHTPSIRPTKKDPTGVSCIVPMCTHIDQTEHDLDVVVTEQVHSPTAPSATIIARTRDHQEDSTSGLQTNLATLTEPNLVFYRHCLKRAWGHEPHRLWQTLKMHKKLDEKGTMKITSWD
ncbi:hypothetical protein EPUS_02170 [Endocarpon pusillum Z07020]|uniref:Acetyl-CoA hydrolase/transferase C-terminal domain-containing protein n=1 Tax=Endocarpon pusillum (strain Z07020 / HMAS-L-300199) TaxID=1263415 RepID=U1GJF9_ENDPU|nr:uncharacterized protein EPUS_02170 [Endocarpon pusillum Z07020]ERF72283.1 hypothetical protein EPUS_02170 [Endocarpon pusillum Z07020]